MKQILRTGSLSLAESLSIALEADGIAAVVSNQNLAGVPPSAVTVSIADEQDLDRALAILRELERDAPSSKVVRHLSQRLLLVVVTILIALVLVLCVTYL